MSVPPDQSTATVKTRIWVPVVVATILLVLVAGMWTSLDRQRDENLHDLIDAEAQRYALLIESDMRSWLPALGRVVDRWQLRKGTPEVEFLADVRVYIEDLPGFQALEWVDSSYHVCWVMPLKGNKQAVDLNLGFEEKRRVALEVAKNSKTPTMSSPIDLVQGGKGFLVYFPIFVDDKFDGFLLAVFKITPWLDYIFNLGGNDEFFKAAVSIDGEGVYEQQGTHDLTYTHWLVDKSHEILGHKILIEVAPTQYFFGANHSSQPEGAALIGLLLTLLITSMVVLSQKVTHAATASHHANSLLRGEVQDRIEAEELLAYNARELDFQKMALDEHAIVSITDVQGNITYVNDKFCDISGYSREELIGQNHRLVKSEEHTRQFYNKLWQTISDGKPWHGEIKNLKKGGGHYWVKASIVPFLNDEGKPFQYVAIRTDITERKEAEKILREHTDYVELMHGVTSAASLFKDSDEALKSILEYLCGFVGWPIAHIYFLSPTDPDLLVPSDIWFYKDFGRHSTFHDATMETDFKTGVGLPGKVLESGEPLWIEDVTHDQNFPRAPYAKASGIKAGFAFPVKAAGRVKGIIEFFSTETIETDAAVMKTLNQVSDQIGRVIERKQADHDAKQREIQFRDFGAAASDWYWEMDEQLRFSYFSESFTDKTGVSEEQLLGKTRQERGNPGATPQAWQEHLDVLAAHKSFRNFIHPRTKPDGSEVWLSINGKPYFDVDGHFLGYRGTGTDVTEMRVSQQRLIDLSAAIDEMSEPVAVFDDDDKFLFTNDAYRKLNIPVIDTVQAGCRFEDHIRAVADQGLSPDAVGCEDGWVAERLAQHRNPYGAFEMKRQDGTWFLATEKKLPSGGQVLLLTDISKMKYAQDELLVAKTDAETANQAKSEFLSSMSHELRTPLNAILGFSQMLEYNPKEPLTETQKSSVEQIMKGGHHLLDLINDVLDLARIEAGKVELSLEDVSMQEVFEECLSLVDNIASMRGINISVSVISENDRMVWGDFTRVKQVLLNLMSNAIKYNREGGSVRVNIEEVADSKMRISVIDDGPGISKDVQHELFQAFSRLGAESSDIEGTGIGLVVCKDLMELMNGAIGFESEEGKGSTFWFELPMSDTFFTESIDGRTALVGVGQLPDIDGTMLYIEDNPSNLQLMEMIVEGIDGLSMLSAHTAELGIDIARSKRPDVILLDINLPGMSGLDAVKALKGWDETKNIPTMALSAAATKNDIDKGLAAGFDRYLTKPVLVSEVTEALRKAMV
ncbi:MAG: PAS domain S-box protein [Rhodospirillaceae bacterium]|nr:PAS domain S-box protein [Rhodospirillaceae bacterium]MBT7356625.1 PAS domain S-box protein [Rhodospirillaceae bacterium]